MGESCNHTFGRASRRSNRESRSCRINLFMGKPFGGIEYGSPNIVIREERVICLQIFICSAVGDLLNNQFNRQSSSFDDRLPEHDFRVQCNSFEQLVFFHGAEVYRVRSCNHTFPQRMDWRLTKPDGRRKRPDGRWETARVAHSEDGRNGKDRGKSVLRLGRGEPARHDGRWNMTRVIPLRLIA
jgi:hypothetical protein